MRCNDVLTSSMTDWNRPKHVHPPTEGGEEGRGGGEEGRGGMGEGGEEGRGSESK